MVQPVCSSTHLHFVALQPALVLVVGLGSLLRHFLLQVWPPSEEDIVDKRILQQSQEDEDKAAHEVYVDGLDVRNLWQSLPQMSVDGGHRQHRCYAWRQRTW